MQGSIRKKGKSYYIRYYQDGKQIERIGGKTKKEAQSKLNEILYKLENGYTISSDMFISDYLDMWLDDYIKDIRSENTYVKYKNICDKYIIPVLGDIKLSALKVIHIEKLIRHFRKEGLNPTSTQNYYGIIRAALNKAVKLQLLNDNPCKFIDTPKRGKFKANTLTVQEFYLIYDKLNAELYEDYIFKLALDIALETGLRRGEMCGLTWDDIDFNNKCIHINQALIRVDNTYTISSLKTDSSYRSLPVSDALLIKLENH
ncbi:MAG: tyrosine-type recombinase/integrase family protein, partial [Peptostreptococcaceae bacterium]|nr:tyrosine-type recombinase/integrase family protein [Peptostreptococcaceae bacterium]